MITLIYNSTTIETCSTIDLPLFLNTIRDDNIRLNITGILLYHDGKLMQILEGEKEIVYEIFEKIKVDKRHTDVTKLIEFNITKRCYFDWSMAFKKLSANDWSAIKGYLNLENKQTGLPGYSTKSTYLKVLIDSFIDENEILLANIITLSDIQKPEIPLLAIDLNKFNDYALTFLQKSK